MWSKQDSTYSILRWRCRVNPNNGTDKAVGGNLTSHLCNIKPPGVESID
jgi:hypothetical protein